MTTEGQREGEMTPPIRPWKDCPRCGGKGLTHLGMQTCYICRLHFKAVDEAVQTERERCADIADQHNSVEGIVQKIAQAIRGDDAATTKEPKQLRGGTK